MANPISTFDIETLDQWNQVLTACSSCCEMPGCPVPSVEYQSRTGTETKSGAPPYIRPGGNDGEPLPLLYATQEDRGDFKVIGQVGDYYGWNNEGGGVYYEELIDISIDEYQAWDGPFEDNTISKRDWNEAHLDGSNYVIDDSGTSGSPAYDGYFSDYEVSDVWSYSHTATLYTEKQEVTSYTGSSMPSLQGGGAGTEGLEIVYVDIVQTDTGKFTLDDPFAPEDLRDDAVADAEGTAWPGTGTNSFASYVLTDWPTVDEPAYDSITDDAAGADNAGLWSGDEKYTPDADVIDVRFRFQIPDSWEGGYFKIIYDLVEEPDGWDSSDPDAPTRTFIEDLEVIWTGPGSGGPTDPSWYTDWVALRPPSRPGRRRVVNIRYECYVSPFGNKPESVGSYEEDTSGAIPSQAGTKSALHTIHIPTL